MSTGVLSVAYGLCLCYLFMGIAIVAEIFMEAIEKITSERVVINIVDNDGNERSQKILRWNGTVANLTLMALGSSAPEILLAVLETSSNLGKCPGELGASTIVGSAAFNLLVISGLSIYAVTPENDNEPDRDPDVPQGYKKIYDMRVFTITATSSIWAYIWLWIVLLDQKVSVTEAVLTFVYFFILIILAYGADKVTANAAKKEAEKNNKGKEDAPTIKYSANEITRTLIAEKQGSIKGEAEERKVDEMKRFLKRSMGTDRIEDLNQEELQKKIDGEGLISRIKYRKQFGNFIQGKRPVVAKGERLKLENVQAKSLAEKDKNEFFGFKCLHYSVSESTDKLQVVIFNKNRQPNRVRVTTIDGDAKANEDYTPVDAIVEFARGEYQKTIDIAILDDDQWEPDEDFFVQLYDSETNNELFGLDTKCTITIIDDDKPGQIFFPDAKGIKVSVKETEVEIKVGRKNGCDGQVTVDYATKQLGNVGVAVDGVHYNGTNGTLVFENQETEKSVFVQLI